MCNEVSINFASCFDGEMLRCSLALVFFRLFGGVPTFSSLSLSFRLLELEEEEEGEGEGGSDGLELAETLFLLVLRGVGWLLVLRLDLGFAFVVDFCFRLDLDCLRAIWPTRMRRP